MAKSPILGRSSSMRMATYVLWEPHSPTIRFIYLSSYYQNVSLKFMPPESSGLLPCRYCGRSYAIEGCMPKAQRSLN